MRLRVTCEESNAFPMSGRATLATDRFRLATAATRISETRTRPARSRDVEDAPAPAPAAPPPGIIVSVTTSILQSQHLATGDDSEFSRARVVVEDDRSRQEVREPASPFGEQHGDEAGDIGTREHEPDEAHERATDRGGAPAGP